MNSLMSCFIKRQRIVVNIIQSALLKELLKFLWENVVMRRTLYADVYRPTNRHPINIGVMHEHPVRRDAEDVLAVDLDVVDVNDGF